MSSFFSILVLWIAAGAQPAFTSSDPVQAVRDALRSATRNAGSSFVVTKEKLAALPDPGRGIVYTARPLGEDPGARNFPVEVQVKKDGRPVASRTLVFARNNTQVRVVPRRDIQPGEIINDGLVQLSAVRGKPYRNRYATCLGQVYGSTAKVRLVAGRAIELRHLQQPLAVKRGEKITVSIRSGQMVVQMTGKSLEDGVVGQRVRIVNPRSGRSFTAEMTGPGQAMMEMQ